MYPEEVAFFRSPSAESPLGYRFSGAEVVARLLDRDVSGAVSGS
jgi:hypothetical protein